MLKFEENIYTFCIVFIYFRYFPMAPFIQIKSISLTNFKNVTSGSVDFKNNILGIYGQNGSGKTALVDALEIFQTVANGEALPASSENFIKSDSDFAECALSFDFFNDEGLAESVVEYVFKFQRCQQGVEIVYEQILEKKVGKRKNIQIICFDKSQENSWITPVADWEFAFASKESTIKFEVLKKKTENSPVAKLNAIGRIRLFAQVFLFVIKSCGRSPFNINFALPFNFRHEEDKSVSFGSLPINLQKPTVFPTDLFALIDKSFEEMNIVLKEIIPGLKVVVKNEGSQQTQDGKEGVRFELLSKKSDAAEIPLRYESEGVKKIISILSILISVYNNPATFLAVDELDAGIFEFLLGEILDIIDEKAKGRLLFTSHNLRPLEMIKKESLMYTTTNAANRYIRLSGIQANNNPRNVYLRSISLGGQKEDIYQKTNRFKIDSAFRHAGKINDVQS